MIRSITDIELLQQPKEVNKGLLEMSKAVKLLPPHPKIDNKGMTRNI